MEKMEVGTPMDAPKLHHHADVEFHAGSHERASLEHHVISADLLGLAKRLCLAALYSGQPSRWEASIPVDDLVVTRQRGTWGDHVATNQPSKL